MQCPNCGSENRDAAKFCDECGLPLGGAIARAAAAEPLLKPVEPTEGSDDNVEAPAEPIGEEESGGSSETEQDAQEPTGQAEIEQEDRADDAPEADAETHASNYLERETNAEITRPLESSENNPESELEDITQMIGDPEVAPDITKAYDEDEFAGFNKPAEDDFSFSDPLNYDGNDLNALNAHGPGYTMKMPRVENEPAEKNRDFIASSTVPKKSHAKVIAIVVGIVAAIAAIVGVTFALGMWGGKTVPDVVGMTETDARAILEDSSFAVRATQVKSDDTEGLVLIMDPASGSRAPEGSEVVIHVATARLIPDVVGKTSEEALALLADSLAQIAAYGRSAFPEISLRIEPLDILAHKKNVLGTTQEAIALCEAVAARGERIALCFDTAHAILNGEDIVQSIADAGKWIEEFHLCNACTAEGHALYGDRHIAPGAPGTFEIADYARFIEAAKQHCPDARVYTEYMCPDDMDGKEMVDHHARIIEASGVTMRR